jgi:hypothetical protein
MAVTIPDKLIVGKINFGTTSVSTFWNNGDAYDGAFLSFTANFDITPQAASYPDNSENPNLYNANDIQIGWKFALPSGRIYTVKSIIVNSDTNADIEIEDTDLVNYVSSPSLDNNPTEDSYGIFYEYVDGVAKLSNLTNNINSFPNQGYWIDDIFGDSIKDLSTSGSGSAGTAGTSGSSGSSGSDGTSGSNGTDGSSGTSGFDGVSGTSGTSGSDGTSGSSGISGVDGTDGSSGTSGVDGVSGTSGTSGSSGISGVDGTDGSSGTSGVDGVSGTSGTSGSSGSSGDSLFAQTGSFWATTNNIQITGSLDITSTLGITDANIIMTDSSSLYMTSGSNIYVDGGIISGAYIYGDGSNLINIPASGVTGLQLNLISSGSATASISPDGLQINVPTSITGALNVDGIITARQLNIDYVSSSIMYTSGSTKFGDTIDDTHEFTGFFVYQWFG